MNTRSEAPSPRAINWLGHTSQYLRSRFAETRDCSGEIAEELSRLLLARLPVYLGSKLLTLLPKDVRLQIGNIHVRAGGKGNPDIQYRDFALKTLQILRSRHPFQDEGALHPLATRVTDAFLWAVVNEVDPLLKARIAETLPTEFRSRMSLYSGTTEEEKVA